MNPKILIVDDEPDAEPLFRQNLRREVKAGNFSLEFASSGEAALAQMNDDEPPQVLVVMSDINMPGGMSGLELLSELRPKRPDLSIFMVTAYSDDTTRSDAIERGADAFFTKPVDFKALRADLARLLDQR